MIRSSINRKEALSIIVLLITSFFASAQEVNFRRVENSHIIDATTLDTISSHSSDTEAAQQLLNLQFANREVYMVGARYVVDVKNAQTTQVTDTIYIGDDWSGLTNMKVVDTLDVLVRNYGGIRSRFKGVLTDCCNIYPVSKDSLLEVPYYTFTAKLERLKEWPTATTSYKLVETPFFFYKSDSVVSIDPQNNQFRYRTFANKKHCIKYIVNGVERPNMSCEPGNSTYAGGSFRHTNTLNDIDMSIDNLIEYIAVDLDSTTVIGKRQYLLPKQ